MWDIVYSSFKPPIELFSFPFLFHSYCHSVVHRVLSYVAGGCNESSFVFLYIVFESLLLLLLFLASFFTPDLACQWSDNKSTIVSTTILSIQADLNPSVVWIISAHPPISIPPSPFTNNLEIFPISTGITVTSRFHSSFNVHVLVTLFVVFGFDSVVYKDGKVLNSARSLFC